MAMPTKATRPDDLDADARDALKRAYALLRARAARAARAEVEQQQAEAEGAGHAN